MAIEAEEMIALLQFVGWSRLVLHETPPVTERQFHPLQFAAQIGSVIEARHQTPLPDGRADDAGLGALDDVQEVILVVVVLSHDQLSIRLWDDDEVPCGIKRDALRGRG